MELALTKEQRKYLDKHGPMKASTLERVYEQSVQDQQKMLHQAKKLRAKQQKTIA